MRLQAWRWTELLQMLGVAIIGSHSHVDSQALGEVRHRLCVLVTAFPTRWSAARLSTHQSFF